MKIKEIHLLSNNIIETERFYNTTLAVETEMMNKEEVSFLIGTTRLVFKKSAVQQPNYHLAFDIPNNKLEEAFNWLAERTLLLPVTESSKFASFESWNATSIYFYDNNKNLLELICRADLLNESALPFSSNALLYISEIGIVTDNVQEMADELIDKYGLAYYDKQTKQENFVVLGDETGLFILVSPDRNWYPTTKKTKSFETRIVFDTESGNDRLLIIEE